MATMTISSTTAVESGTLCWAMPFTSRKPRPRWDENISPIRTPSRLSEKAMRSPAMMSGRQAGTSTQRMVLDGDRRSTRAVRIKVGAR